MGEIADMMLEGELCCECGVYIGADNGYPTKCVSCAKTKEPSPRPRVTYDNGKEKCPVCGKWKTNVEAHAAAVHPEVQP